MKPIDSQNHYELLEVPTTASSEDVEQAYRLLSASYAEDSLALYSLFEADDAAGVRQRVDEAYRVLSDPELRSRYDEALRSGGELLPEAAQPEPPPERQQPALSPLGAPMGAFEDYEEDEQQGYDGARLRRARLRRGIEIEQVAAVTKINPTYIRSIEADAYEDLPAPVYVRGFVSAYARAIGLEEKRVAGSYMARLEEEKSARRPGRMLGLR